MPWKRYSSRLMRRQKNIADRIEEMEREEVFVKKLIRQRMTKAKNNNRHI